jgi:uncharacterized LabA/DUF88 family protein
MKDDEELKGVYYFTAYTHWNPDRMSKHRKYVAALMAHGVKPVLGKFKEITRKCNLCHQYYITHEEKRSDVNVALFLFNSAVKNEFDKAIIVSGDSDMIPSIDMIKAEYPEKKVGVMVPFGLMAREIRNAADFQLKMKLEHLENSRLTERVLTASGVLEAPIGCLQKKKKKKPAS